MGKINKTLVLVTLIFLVGCASPGGAGVDPTLTLPAGTVNAATDLAAQSKGQGHLAVFAAASLSGAFMEIGKEFEAAKPGVQVDFNFAGSQILRTQLEQGASADLFASADHKNIDSLVADQLVDPTTIQDFATNHLVVILPKDNPASLSGLADLARPGIKLILADASVPAGNYARQALAKMDADPAFGSGYSKQVLANLVSNETDVKQVVAKVELGEADAGIVYVSDAVAAPELKTIAIPDQWNVTARYPIGIMKAAHMPALASEFIDFVLSPTGQAILEKWGFTGVKP